MRWYNLGVTILGAVACIWLVWAYRWLGAYMLVFIAAAYFIADHSGRFGIHPLVAVGVFCILGLFVGRRLFPQERTRPR